MAHGRGTVSGRPGIVLVVHKVERRSTVKEQATDISALPAIVGLPVVNYEKAEATV